MRYPAGKNLRLKRRRNIARVFEHGRRASGALVTLVAAPSPDGPEAPARLCAAVSTKHGGAVKRNRIRRLCREAFRLAGPEVPVGWDYVLVPRVGAAITLTGLRQAVLMLARRLTSRPRKEAE